MPSSRRQFIALSSASLAAMPLGRLAWAQAQQPPPVVPKFEPVRRNVGIFTARGGTIGWLVNPDAVIVVDTQFPDTAQKCVDGLAERSKRGIDLVINTHHHGDHTGGNGVFRSKAKRILAHARVPELQKQAAAAQTGQANQTPPVFPDATFEKTWQETAGDERISAKHYGPGHTGGDAVIRFERANVVHMGDLLFHERHPRVDRPAGASIQNWMATLDAVAKEMPAETIYIAGHSKEGLPLTVDRKALAQFRNYFDAVLTYVRQGISAGRSKEEIAKLDALKGFETYQGAGAVLSLAGVLGVAYDELTSKS
jgi:cyclase